MVPPSVPYAVLATLHIETFDASVAAQDRGMLTEIVDCVLQCRRILLNRAALPENRIVCIRIVSRCTSYLGALGIVVWGMRMDDSDLRLVLDTLAVGLEAADLLVCHEPFRSSAVTPPASTHAPVAGSKHKRPVIEGAGEDEAAVQGKGSASEEQGKGGVKRPAAAREPSAHGKAESELDDDARDYVDLVRLSHGVHAGFTRVCHVSIIGKPLELLAKLKTEFDICELPDDQDELPRRAMARMALQDIRCGASGSANGTACLRGVLATVLALVRNILPVPGRRFVHDRDSTAAEAVAQAEIARWRKQANPAS